MERSRRSKRPVVRQRRHALASACSDERGRGEGCRIPQGAAFLSTVASSFHRQPGGRAYGEAKLQAVKGWCGCMHAIGSALASAAAACHGWLPAVAVAGGGAVAAGAFFRAMGRSLGAVSGEEGIGWRTRPRMGDPGGARAACGAVIRARWHRRGASSYGFSRAGGRQRQPGDGDGRCMHGWRRCTSPSVIPPPPRVDLFFTTGLSDATTSIRTY